MKVTSLKASNFGSYRSLDLSLEDRGLVLIQGPTGAGKSTVMDAVCWVLYGLTAKGGPVDSVKSWGSTDLTTGEAAVLLPNGSITVTRTRGKASQNDLYWTESGSEDKRRGKDLADTQRLLASRLGVDFDQYTAASYFNEFNFSASFFVAKAKDRRAILDTLCDLSFPVKALEALRAALTATNARTDELETLISSEQSAVQQISSSIRITSATRDTWLSTQAEKNKRKAEQEKSEAKIKLQAHLLQEGSTLQYIGRLEQQTSECPACRRSIGDTQRLLHEAKQSLQLIRAGIRSLTALLNREEAEKPRTEDPYLPLLQEMKGRLTESISKVLDAEDLLETAYSNKDRLKTLVDLTSDLRSAILQSTIRSLEDLTNGYLERFFDSEIRVSLTIQPDDTIDVLLHKGEYECAYSQLSKGQRSLLRLAFSVSVMKLAANKAGVHFDNLYFDEALDGLDVNLKLKAYGLFEELSLEHSSVFVIDHSEELKQLFSTRYSVSLDVDNSTLVQDDE